MQIVAVTSIFYKYICLFLKPINAVSKKNYESYLRKIIYNKLTNFWFNIQNSWIKIYKFISL